MGKLSIFDQDYTDLLKDKVISDGKLVENLGNDRDNKTYISNSDLNNQKYEDSQKFTNNNIISNKNNNIQNNFDNKNLNQKDLFSIDKVNKKSYPETNHQLTSLYNHTEESEIYKDNYDNNNSNNNFKKFDTSVKNKNNINTKPINIPKPKVNNRILYFKFLFRKRRE